VIRRLHTETPERFAVHLEAFDATLATAERAGTVVLK
jgi:hypothetical protein